MGASEYGCESSYLLNTYHVSCRWNSLLSVLKVTVQEENKTPVTSAQHSVDRAVRVVHVSSSFLETGLWGGAGGEWLSASVIPF